MPAAGPCPSAAATTDGGGDCLLVRFVAAHIMQHRRVAMRCACGDDLLQLFHTVRVGLPRTMHAARAIPPQA